MFVKTIIFRDFYVVTENFIKILLDQQSLRQNRLTRDTPFKQLFYQLFTILKGIEENFNEKFKSVSKFYNSVDLFQFKIF